MANAKSRLKKIEGYITGRDDQWTYLNHTPEQVEQWKRSLKLLDEVLQEEAKKAYACINPDDLDQDNDIPKNKIREVRAKSKADRKNESCLSGSGRCLL